ELAGRQQAEPERDPDRPVQGRAPRGPPQPALGVVFCLGLLRWRHTLLDRGHPFSVEEAPAPRAVDHEGHDRHTGDDSDDQGIGVASHLSLIGRGTLLRRPADRAAPTRVLPVDGPSPRSAGCTGCFIVHLQPPGRAACRTPRGLHPGFVRGDALSEEGAASEEVLPLWRAGRVEEARLVLVRTTHPSVYRYLKAMVRDAHVAEDLTQDTFVRAVQAVGSY